MLIRLITLVAFATSAFAFASDAAAEPTIKCDALTGCHVSDSASSGGSGGDEAAPACSAKGTAVPCAHGDAVFDSETSCYEGPAHMPPPDGPVLAQYQKYGGSIRFATCPFGGAGGYVWVPPAKPVVTPELVREQAQRLVPSAAVGIAPKGTSLVNIETVLWADAPERRDLASVEILGQRVVISLRLEHVSWDFGDGQRDENGPAGKPYDDERDPCRQRQCVDYYGHEYRRTGAMTVQATAHWHVTFTVDGGESRDAGGVPGPPARASVTIKQTRAVLVPNPQEGP